jgi:guanylate kinase
MFSPAAIRHVFNASGPYGVGKDTVLNFVLEKYSDAVHRVTTLTTRPASPKDDPSYTTVDIDEMKKRTATGEWIITRQLGGTVLYATSIDEIRQQISAGKICVHSIYANPDGAGRIREIFGADLFSIGLLAAPGGLDKQIEILRERLLARGREGGNEISARLANQVEPVNYVLENRRIKVLSGDGGMPVFDQVIVNDNLDETIADVTHIFGEVFSLGGLRRSVRASGGKSLRRR